MFQEEKKVQAKYFRKRIFGKFHEKKFRPNVSGGKKVQAKCFRRKKSSGKIFQEEKKFRPNVTGVKKVQAKYFRKRFF